MGRNVVLLGMRITRSRIPVRHLHIWACPRTGGRHRARDDVENLEPGSTSSHRRHWPLPLCARIPTMLSMARLIATSAASLALASAGPATFYAPAASSPESGYAPVNGLKLYYEIRGTGAPVVVLHGGL